MRPRMSSVHLRRRLTMLAVVAIAGVLAFASTPGFAQPGPAPDAGAAAEATQYRVENARTFDDVNRIAATGAAIDEIEHGFVYVTATPAEVRFIRGMGFRAHPVSHPHVHDGGHHDDAGPAPSDGTVEPDFSVEAYPPGYQGYHDYDELVAVVDQVVAAHPQIAQRHSFGTSHEGRDLIAVKISDNVNVDEGEPEVLLNAGQHAREHLTVEMAIYLLRMFTEEYGVDQRITDLVNSRVIWILPNVNPDGAEYDIATGSFRSWRKNRQPTPNSPYVGTDLNRNWGHQWGGSGSSGSPSSSTYRGWAPFSATEVDHMRDFVLSRVIDGEQRITVNIDFHTYSELVLWPYGYTSASTAPGLNADARDTFVTIGEKMAASNGYTPMQSSQLYIASGISIDWMWADQGIFAYTFEMYPRSGSGGGFYPPDSVIARETARNREAVLELVEYADCPWRAIGKEQQYCGTGGGTTVFHDDFSTSTGWTRSGNATAGLWERGAPEATSWNGIPLQLGTPQAGSNTLVTGRLAGSSPGDHDIDDGATIARSPAISLPSGSTSTLTLSWYLSHLNNSSSADYFQVTIEHAGGSTVVLNQTGSATNRAAAWTTSTINLAPYAGQTIRVVIAAADEAGGSLVEAAVDYVRITAS
jgi:carboxypeptidase T